MAGRKKAGVTSGLAEGLAQFLRQLRRRPDGSDLTYAEMAARLGGKRYCSATTLSRADQGGDHIPRAETVRGYARACGASSPQVQHAHRLLTAANRRRLLSKTASGYDDPKVGSRMARMQHPAVAPHPDYIRSHLDLQNGLRSYRREAGNPSVRSIAHNADLSGRHITKSTVQRMLSPAGMFLSWQHVEAFLVGCRPERLPDLEPWRRAWRRVFLPSSHEQKGYPTWLEAAVAERVRDAEQQQLDLLRQLVEHGLLQSSDVLAIARQVRNQVVHRQAST